MKLKLSLLVLLFTFFQSFSQTERYVQGRVVSNEMAVSSVDIINLNTKASTTSDKNGNFKIAATVFETLIFISEAYYDTKVKITHENVAKSLIVK